MVLVFHLLLKKHQFRRNTYHLEAYSVLRRQNDHFLATDEVLIVYLRPSRRRYPTSRRSSTVCHRQLAMQLFLGGLLLSLLMLAIRVQCWQSRWMGSIQRLSMSTKRGDKSVLSSRSRNDRRTNSGAASTRSPQQRSKPIRDEKQDEITPIVHIEHPYVKNYVTLLPGKARLFQDGNPLVFGGAVKEVFGQPLSGAEVIVKDHRGNDLGRGFYNPDSQYRVRLMSRSYEDVFQSPLTDIITKRINDAIIHRKTISLPSAVTSIYRLVNGEGDRLGGLMIDVIGSIVVIQSSAVWVEANKSDIVKALTDILIRRENYSIRKIIWRRVDTRLKQDGYVGEVGDEVVYTKSADDLTIKKEVVAENGIKYAVFPDDGQKTGFYCDQRGKLFTHKQHMLHH